MNKKVLIIIMLIVSLLAIGSLFLKNKKLDTKYTLAIMLNGSEYTTSNDWPTGNIEYEKSTCVDGNGASISDSMITYNNSTRVATVKNNASNKKEVHCTLQFKDKEIDPEITSFLIDSKLVKGGTKFTNNTTPMGTIKWTSNKIRKVCLSTSSTSCDGSWITVNASDSEKRVQVNLGNNDGIITRYAFIEDESGNKIGPANDTITLDKTGPYCMVGTMGCGGYSSITENAGVIQGMTFYDYYIPPIKVYYHISNAQISDCSSVSDSNYVLYNTYNVEPRVRTGNVSINYSYSAGNTYHFCIKTVDALDNTNYIKLADLTVPETTQQIKYYCYPDPVNSDACEYNGMKYTYCYNEYGNCWNWVIDSGGPILGGYGTTPPCRSYPSTTCPGIIYGP